MTQTRLIALMVAALSFHPSGMSRALAQLASRDSLPALSFSGGTDGVGKPKERQPDAREWDLSIGYAGNLQLPPDPTRSVVRFITLMPRYGWFHGSRNEVLLEVPFIISIDPRQHGGLGVNGMFRHHLTSKRKLAPFLEIGAGILATNIRVRELSGSFQFAPQAGIGLRIPNGARSDLSFGLRFHHISNANIRRPNVGINSLLVMIGVTRSL